MVARASRTHPEGLCLTADIAGTDLAHRMAEHQQVHDGQLASRCLRDGAPIGRAAFGPAEEASRILDDTRLSAFLR